MTIEEKEELQNFYADLEKKQVICSKCADELIKNTTFLLIGSAFSMDEDRINLHIRCITQLIRSLNTI